MGVVGTTVGDWAVRICGAGMWVVGAAFGDKAVGDWACVVGDAGGIFWLIVSSWLRVGTESRFGEAVETFCRFGLGLVGVAGQPRRCREGMVAFFPFDFDL